MTYSRKSELTSLSQNETKNATEVDKSSSIKYFGSYNLPIMFIDKMTLRTIKLEVFIVEGLEVVLILGHFEVSNVPKIAKECTENKQ